MLCNISNYSHLQYALTSLLPSRDQCKYDVKVLKTLIYNINKLWVWLEEELLDLSAGCFE